MAKNMQLNGAIHAVFDTESAMAKSLGWSRQRLNKITNGRKVPDLFEVNDMARVLNMPFSSVAGFFLPGASTIVD